MRLIVSICLLAIVCWLMARAARQGRALVRVHPRPAAPPEMSGPVSVIVPARDESANISQCLGTLLDMDAPPDGLEIIVVDDDSSDDTAAIAKGLAEGDSRLKVVPAGPLPAGRVGKPHACATGAKMARRGSQWLCFVDADMRLAPGAVAAAIGEATRARLDMLCLTPRYDLVTPLERLIIPSGLYVLAFTKRLETQGDGGEEPTATGQFMLVRRKAYEAVGGHEAVAGEIAEDLALARRFADAGHKVRLMGGEHLMSVRMYRDGLSLWLGFAKNLAELFGHPANTVAIALAGFALPWLIVLLPMVLLMAPEPSWGGVAALAVATLAFVVTLAFHVAGAIVLRIPVWYGLIFPVGYTAAALLALDSVRRRFGGATRWKGRTYP